MLSFEPSKWKIPVSGKDGDWSPSLNPKRRTNLRIWLVEGRFRSLRQLNWLPLLFLVKTTFTSSKIWPTALSICFSDMFCFQPVLVASKVQDHPELPNPAVRAFASLGCDTKFGGNLERDLHRWLSGLYNFRLQAYTIYLKLQESWGKCLMSKFVFHPL